MSYSQAPPVYSGSQPKGYQSVSQSENSSQPGDSNPFESDQPRTEGDADPEVSIFTLDMALWIKKRDGEQVEDGHHLPAGEFHVYPQLSRAWPEQRD